MQANQQTLINRSISMEIFIYLLCFTSYTVIFYSFAMILLMNKVINIGHILIIYLGSLLILILASIHYSYYFRYRAIYLNLTWNQHITEEEITNVLHEKYIMENDDVENKWELCFCMEDKENAEYVKLPCEHIFHTQCIAKWLATNNSCPNCREKNIIVKNDFIRS